MKQSNASRVQYIAAFGQRGLSLIEILVTLILVAVGLLGLVGLLVQSQRSQFESYQRVQALTLLDDMVGRIQANRAVARCYAVSSASGDTFLGNGSSLTDYQAGASTTPSCDGASAQQGSMVLADLRAWNALLLGAGEIAASGDKAGAMIGARGCVQAITGSPHTYQVSVVWQGIADTASPTGINCASGDAAALFGSAARRRAVSAVVQIATLN